jgi:predicted SprT family Zn-dependent metalloprotease
MVLEFVLYFDQGVMNLETLWYLCPVCSKRLLKYRRDTVLVNFPAYCKQCKTERLITFKYKIEPVSRMTIQ